MKWQSAVKNFAVFAAALVVGPYIGNFVNNALVLPTGNTEGIIIGYAITFTVYVVAARSFKARPSFD